MKKLLSIFLVLCMTSPAFGAGVEINEERLDLNGNLKLNKFRTPYAQTLVVAKSGGDYTTLTEALNNITDASTSKRYCIKVMPGTYSETVTCKAYVDIIGASQHDVIITQANADVVTIVANVLLKDLTIQVSAPNAVRQCSLATTALSDTTLDNILFDVTGNYSHKAINLSGAVANTLVIKNCSYANASNNNGMLLYTVASGVQTITIENCTGSTFGYSLYFDANGTGSVFTLRNNKFVAANGVYLYNCTGTGTVNSYNNSITGAIINIRAGAGNTYILNSYDDVFTSITKIGAGGTETFNSYGSNVSGSTVVATSGIWGVVAAGGLPIPSSNTVRIVGAAAAIDISANPQIADGYDGQDVTFVGLSDVNTVKFDDGNGIALGAASITLGVDDTITLYYDLAADLWRRKGNADN